MGKRLAMLLLAIALVGCSEQSNATSYEEVKKMMVDALQTDDGKKALRQILEDPTFRELLVLQHEEVKQATEQTLLSKDAEDFWKKSFEDPKFKEAFAKSLKKQQEEILKSLLNDASYQEQLTSFFGQPDMQKQLENILKGKTVRKEIEKVVSETIENPLLQTKWEKLIKESGGNEKKEEEKKSNE